MCFEIKYTVDKVAWLSFWCERIEQQGTEWEIVGAQIPLVSQDDSGQVNMVSQPLGFSRLQDVSLIAWPIRTPDWFGDRASGNSPPIDGRG